MISNGEPSPAEEAAIASRAILLETVSALTCNQRAGRSPPENGTWENSLPVAFNLAVMSPTIRLEMSRTSDFLSVADGNDLAVSAASSKNLASAMFEVKRDAPKSAKP